MSVEQKWNWNNPFLPIDYCIEFQGLVSQSGPTFHKPILTGPDHLVALYMLRDGTWDDLLHNLSQHQVAVILTDPHTRSDVHHYSYASLTQPRSDNPVL